MAILVMVVVYVVVAVDAAAAVMINDNGRKPSCDQGLDT
jgi:hypothetical protein